MGYANSHDVACAGNYLLSLLASEDRINYSRFYNDSDETQSRLLEGMGYSDPDDEDAPECPAVYMDIAVGQLVSSGIVTTRETGDLLPDEEPNYEIVLTDFGREFLKGSRHFDFHDVML